VLKLFDKRLNTEEFNTAVVGIGALGVVSTVTIQLVATYNLSISNQTFSFEEMIANINKFETDDYMRFWWAPHTNRVQYWKAFRTTENVTKQSKTENWFQDIFKGNIIHEFGLWITSFFPNSIIKTLLKEKQYKVHMPIEVRFAPSNESALSMAYGTKTCYIGIIAYKPYGKVIDYKAYFNDVHDIFAAHQGRPHWAKVTHYSKEELSAQYPKWNDFVQLKNKLDPKGMFMNDFLKRIF